ncbi:hypothetical protein K1X84_06945 [bacterium]|nr:hypothetical protein [bacterium]
MKNAFITLIVSNLLLLASSLAAQPESWSHREINWYTIKTKHFDIHYHDNAYSKDHPEFKGPVRTAKLVAKIAEEIYEPITQLYQYRPERVHFIIRDTDDYSNGGAYYFDNKIEIWASSLNFELRGAHNWLRNVVTHEFTHMVSIQASMKLSRHFPAVYLQYIGYEKERRQDVLRGFPNIIASYPVSTLSIPVWFAEGVAQYQQKNLDYEYWDSHRDMILRSRILSGQMLSLTQMSTFGKNSIGNESAYNAGYAFISYLASRFGENVIERITVNNQKKLVSFEAAVKEATGQPLNELYKDWIQYLTTQYLSSTENIKKNATEGTAIEKESTGNFFPAFSPDGNIVAFISNRDNDYLSQTALYLFNIKKQSLKKITNDVEGSVSWSHDGRYLTYAKNLHYNDYRSQVNDIYIYDLEKEKETRITYGLRLSAPAFSPDGQTIVGVLNQDGTNNLILLTHLPVDLRTLSGKNDKNPFVTDDIEVKWLTQFDDGRQIYKPIFHPNGQRIFFDTSIDDGRDIAIIDAKTGQWQMVLDKPYDERSPVISQDGNSLYYSSDETGIFNIYKLDLSNNQKFLLTNVIGGAFYPTVSPNGTISFTLYRDIGYQLNYLSNQVAIEPSNATYPIKNPNLTDQTFYPTRFATYPKSYNDSVTPIFDSVANYRTTFLDFSILPVARIDYGTFKPGAYFYSSDVLNKSSFFGGILFNLTDFDRDLFGIFEFGGFGPTLFLELYNVTRSKTFHDNVDPSNDDIVKYESIQTNRFELREVDTGIDLSLISPRDIRLNFMHSEYFVKIKGKEFEGGEYTKIPSTGNIKYFYGNDFSVSWKWSSLKPSVDYDINPRGGRKINFKYGYNLDHLFEGFAFNSNTGSSAVLYQKAFHHRLEGYWNEFIKIPGTSHTLDINFQGGIVPTKVDSFYNFFGGGLIGLKGYSYYSIEGSRMALLTSYYRFPIFRRIDRSLGFLYLDKIFGAFYFGYGNAWSNKTSFDQFNHFKKDIGGEIRIEFNSFYVYPTRVTFSAAYGLDKFISNGPIITKQDINTGNLIKQNQTVLNGKEWRYYLTILFGFSLFD